VQYKEALYKRFLTTKKNQLDIEKISILKYKSNIKDYMIQTTYYKIQLDLQDPVWVPEIVLGLLSWFKDRCLMKLDKTYNKKNYEVPITIVGLCHEE
jgi:hypothetical protein